MPLILPLLLPYHTAQIVAQLLHGFSAEHLLFLLFRSILLGAFWGLPRLQERNVRQYVLTDVGRRLSGEVAQTPKVQVVSPGTGGGEERSIVGGEGRVRGG